MERADAELARLAGAAPTLERAREILGTGDAPTAIRLAEAVLEIEAESKDAAQILVDAHRHLLDHGGETHVLSEQHVEGDDEHRRHVVASAGVLSLALKKKRPQRLCDPQGDGL